MKCTNEGVLYTSQTYLRFPTQLQPVAKWLVYQAEAVYAKTVSLGSCAKLVSIVMLHLPFCIVL